MGFLARVLENADLRSLGEVQEAIEKAYPGSAEPLQEVIQYLLNFKRYNDHETAMILLKKSLSEKKLTKKPL